MTNKEKMENMNIVIHSLQEQLKATVSELEKVQTKNAELRERLDKAVELPCVEHILTVRWELKGKLGKATENWCVLYKDSREGFIIEPYINKCSADARLSELKGEGDYRG